MNAWKILHRSVGLLLVPVVIAGCGSAPAGPPSGASAVTPSIASRATASTPAPSAETRTTEAEPPRSATVTPRTEAASTPALPEVGTLAPSISVGEGPFHLAAGHGAVWVPNTGGEAGAGGTISRIDPQTNAVVATIPIGDPAKAGRFGVPTAVAVNSDGVWVAKNDTQEVVAIDPHTNGIVATIDLGMLPAPIHYLAAGDGVLWVTSREDADTQPDCCTLVRIDTQTREVVATIPNIPTPGGVAVTDEAVWVVNHRIGTVTRIDPHTNHIVATILVYQVGDTIVCYDCLPGQITANERGVWVTLGGMLSQHLLTTGGHFVVAETVLAFASTRYHWKRGCVYWGKHTCVLW